MFLRYFPLLHLIPDVRDSDIGEFAVFVECENEVGDLGDPESGHFFGEDIGVPFVETAGFEVEDGGLWGQGGWGGGALDG